MSVGSHASRFEDGAAYEATLGAGHAYYIRVKARLFDRIVQRHAPTARRFADLGCGTGEMIERLQGDGRAFTGIDLSSAMIKHARSKQIQNAAFLAGDASHTGLPSAAFDVAFATALFHHVPPGRWTDVAREMGRLVRPGGLVIVYEHNPANPITRRMVRACPVDEGATLLSRKDTRDALQGCGLDIVEERYLLFFPRFLGFLRPLEALLGWCPAGGQYVVVARKPPGEEASR